MVYQLNPNKAVFKKEKGNRCLRKRGHVHPRTEMSGMTDASGTG